MRGVSGGYEVGTRGGYEWGRRNRRYIYVQHQQSNTTFMYIKQHITVQTGTTWAGGRAHSALSHNTRRGAAPRQASNERTENTPTVRRLVSVSLHHPQRPSSDR